MGSQGENTEVHYKQKKGKLKTALPPNIFFGVHRYTLSLTQTHIIVKIYKSSCCKKVVSQQLNQDFALLYTVNINFHPPQF